ncbi:MAG: alpha/beta hydrolase [Candidatus Acidiferrales bacterium]
MRRYYIFAGVTAVLLAAMAVIGVALGRGMPHPPRLPLAPGRVGEADRMFASLGAVKSDFVVRAQDGVVLRGWKVIPVMPSHDWVLLFHGISDNRLGMLGYAEFLVRSGYSVVLMDSRAHGESGGSEATFGWLERRDVQAITDALFANEPVRHLFALGESMGGAIALQAAAIEPRIAAVVAESPFSTLREVSYDYVGMHWSPLLGRTLLWPLDRYALNVAERNGKFRVDDVSPEAAVAQRAFPVLLICDALDHTIPCRHAKKIFAAARGPKEFWEVEGAGHTGAYGVRPEEFERRVLQFFRETATQQK